jgi:hypothetical protein
MAETNACTGNLMVLFPLWRSVGEQVHEMLEVRHQAGPGQLNRPPHKLPSGRQQLMSLSQTNFTREV